MQRDDRNNDRGHVSNFSEKECYNVSLKMKLRLGRRIVQADHKRAFKNTYIELHKIFKEAAAKNDYLRNM